MPEEGLKQASYQLLRTQWSASTRGSLIKRSLSAGLFLDGSVFFLPSSSTTTTRRLSFSFLEHKHTATKGIVPAAGRAPSCFHLLGFDLIRLVGDSLASAAASTGSSLRFLYNCKRAIKRRSVDACFDWFSSGLFSSSASFNLIRFFSFFSLPG